MEPTARRIAEDLLSIRAVFFRPDEPFTWASGIKSPVYCDNRLILTAPDVRTEVETALMQSIRREYPDAEILMGTSTAGIAHAAITAQMMGLPMGYVRSSSKDHGRQNQIEGRLEKGQKVVVVEDLISTGGSVIEVAQALRERSCGKFVLLETSMYPTLYRLQDHHYISSYEELVGKRRKRTYYHIEPAGTAYYQKILAEYLTAQEGIQAILKSCAEKGSPE